MGQIPTALSHNLLRVPLEPAWVQRRNAYWLPWNASLRRCSVLLPVILAPGLTMDKEASGSLLVSAISFCVLYMPGKCSPTGQDPSLSKLLFVYTVIGICEGRTNEY